MSNAVHVYVSQADKGELVMGAGIDAYNGYGQRGSFHVIEHQMAAALELFPMFAHASMLRTWGGIVDVCPDASPIIGPHADRRAVPELRLGHRRLQGDAGLRAGSTPRRSRTASRATSRGPCAGTVHDRGADRRARRGGGRALMSAIGSALVAMGIRASTVAVRPLAARGRGARDLGDRHLPGAEQDLRDVQRPRAARCGSSPSHDEQRALIAMDADAWFAPPYVGPERLGRAPCSSKADGDEVRELIVEAWRMTAPKRLVRRSTSLRRGEA